MSVTTKRTNNFSVDSLLDHYEIIKHTPNHLQGGKIRRRCTFSRAQVDRLEKEFQAHCYLSSEQRTKIATSLSLTEQQVKIWFQNRRYKTKRRHMMDAVCGMWKPPIPRQVAVKVLVHEGRPLPNNSGQGGVLLKPLWFAPSVDLAAHILKLSPAVKADSEHSRE